MTLWFSTVAITAIGAVIVACGGATIESQAGLGLGGNGTPSGDAGGGNGAAGGGSGNGAAGGGGGVIYLDAGGALPDSGSLDCAPASLAWPPLCANTCSWCTCVIGTMQILDGGIHVCRGGCYTPTDDAGATCDYLGRTYPMGVSFAAGDGCNTCSCGDGGSVGCTHRSCSCDPKAEQLQRKYECTSPSDCASIRFYCPENTTGFQNACGGGCEQSPNCPECASAEQACDENAFRTSCPYSCIPLWN
jgi:hypothetical protein